MFDRASLKRDFSRAAAQYEHAAGLQRMVLLACVSLAKQHIPPGARVMDVGCGTGWLAEENATQQLDWRITGADLAFSMCRQAREAHHLPVVNADASALPFRDGNADAVFSSLMLQWLDDPELALNEAYRILKPGGTLVFSSFGPATLLELHAVFARVDARPRVSAFPAALTLAKEVQKAGFELLAHEAGRVVEQYADIRSIMRMLKAMGAANKRADRRRGLTSPRLFAEAEARYRKHFGSAEGLSVTWEVLYFVGRKPF